MERLQKLTWFLALGVLGLSSRAWSAPLKDLPYSIPLQSERPAASDLVFNGKALNPDQAQGLFDSGSIDSLAQLQPADSVLWSASGGAGPASSPFQEAIAGIYAKHSLLKNTPASVTMDLLAINAEDVTREFGFRARGLGEKQEEIYQVAMGGEILNRLIRRALLLKLGYFVPPSVHLKQLEVKFPKGYIQKQDFLALLDARLTRRSELWIRSNPKEAEDAEEFSVVLQDVLLSPGPQDVFYDLSRGPMPKGLIRGRRVLNALLVPYSLTDVTESVNRFDPVNIDIVNGQMLMYYRLAKEFSTPLADAQWISSKLLKLTRQDWEDVAAASAMPSPVQKVLAEKLISRRNELRKYFDKDGNFDEIAVKKGITDLPHVKDGKIVDCNFPNYARQMCGTETAAPLSWKRVRSLFYSKVFTNFLLNTVSDFNERYKLGTDLDEAYALRAKDNYLDALIEGIQNGSDGPASIPRGFYSKEYWGANVFLNREIIKGTYLGVETRENIQLVDTFGYSVEVGNTWLGEGLPVGESASGLAKLSYVQTYSHIRPVQSAKDWRKQPFRNILVPYYKRQLMKSLEGYTQWPKIYAQLAQLVEAGADIEKEKLALRNEEREIRRSRDPQGRKRQVEIRKEIKSLSVKAENVQARKISLRDQLSNQKDALDDQLGVGESLIIDTNIGPELNFRVSHPLDAWALAFAKIHGSFKKISRLHIHRPNDEALHIYVDPATKSTAGMGIGLTTNHGVPLIDIDLTRNRGKLKTRFFKLDLPWEKIHNPDLQTVSEVPEVVSVASRSLSTLRKTLDGGDLKDIQENHKPWTMTHDTKQWRFDLGIFFIRAANERTWNHIEAEGPNGETGAFVRRILGRRVGKDFETFLLNVASDQIRRKWDVGGTFNLTSSNSGDPADSFFGTSNTTQLAIEARVDENAGPMMETLYGRLNHTWRGWYLKTSSFERLLRQIDEKFGRALFDLGDFDNMTSLQFYNVEARVSLYEPAFQFVLNLSKNDIVRIFKSRAFIKPQEASQKSDWETPWPTTALWNLKRLKSAYHTGDRKETVARFADLIEEAERTLTFQGFLKVVGGEDNIWLTGSVSGFRKGQEGNPLPPIEAVQIGELASNLPAGALDRFLRGIGMLSGEFYATWLIQSL